MTNNSAPSLRARSHCLGALKDSLSNRGGRLIRADSPESLKLKACASVKNGTGCRWVTMNHSHVLIKGNELVGGAGRPREGGGQNTGSDAFRISSAGEAREALLRAGFKCTSEEGLSKMDAKLLIDNVNRLLELEHRFGIAARLRGVELKIEPLEKRGIAETSLNLDTCESSLTINPFCYKSLKETAMRVANEVMTRYAMPCLPGKYTVYDITHEFGHLLQNVLYKEAFLQKGTSRNYAARTKGAEYKPFNEVMSDVDKRCVREITAIAKRSDPTFKLKDYLSVYGAIVRGEPETYKEAFAEIFANSQCGAPNAAGAAMNIWLKEKGFLRQNRGDGVEARLDIILRAKDGYTAVLKDGLSYQGSRVIRSDSREALYAKAKAAQRCDWWVTMNGSHVLIKGDRIVGGAGGNLNGKTFGTRFTKGTRSRWLKNRHTWAGSSLGAVENRGTEGPAPEIRNLTQIGAALTGSGFAEANGSSFKNLDKSLVIANMNRVLELEQKFGVAKTLGNVKLEAVSMRSAGGYTTVACIGTEIALSDVEFQFNKQCYGRGSRRVEKTENHTKSGYFMPCAPEDYAVYTATHEYGHLLQNVLYQKELEKRGWSRKDRYALANRDASDPMWIADRYFEARMKVQSRCVREIEKIGKRKDPSFRLFDHLSDYGKTNYAEAFAEMFANSQCGAPNAAGEAMSIWLKEKGFLTE